MPWWRSRPTPWLGAVGRHTQWLGDSRGGFRRPVLRRQTRSVGEVEPIHHGHDESTGVLAADVPPLRPHLAPPRDEHFLVVLGTRKFPGTLLDAVECRPSRLGGSASSVGGQINDLPDRHGSLLRRRPTHALPVSAQVRLGKQAQVQATDDATWLLGGDLAFTRRDRK